MTLPFASFIREWREVFRFRSLSPDERTIVFYSEGPESAPHLAPILTELAGALGRPVCYVTSSAADPVLDWDNDRVLRFRVGYGAARTALFATLQARVMIMTTPDLQTLQLKRSKHPVHYVYVHHAINSMHMAYRPAAFDHFDAILCVGPHHTEEVRQTEAIYGLKEKVLVEHGYGRLDSIIRSAASHQRSRAIPSDGKRVLVAPSWGEHALLETCGEQLTKLLLDAGHHVTVRPHPMTLRHRSRLMKALETRFKNQKNFRLDRDTASERSLHESDIMIGDWGGMSLEYAFGLERPVIYVDLPRKVNNPEYQRLSCEALEVSIRPEIGAVAPPSELETIPGLVEKLCADPQASAARLSELRSRYVYNVGRSGAVGAEYIADVAQRVQASRI